jgi:hypothetical protein
MGQFQFLKLDARTRELMADEILQATKTDNLYYSARFTEAAKMQWPDLLLSAARNHDEHWLEQQLQAIHAMKPRETKSKPSGGLTQANVPDTAAETYADGQFNRFYVAAICHRAIDDNVGSVRVYRAKERAEPRQASRILEETHKDAGALLKEVRGRETSLQCDLLKPNSGLTIDY